MNGKIAVPLIIMVLIIESVFAGGEVANPSESLFNLTILHTNDIHSRFEQTDENGGPCKEKDEKKGNCFGGYARLVYQSRKIREKTPNSIYLHAGDIFQGTVWYTIHKWKVVSNFTNMLNLTAMSLGNHEFDDGIEGLHPFVDNANHPVLAANIDTTDEPSIHGLIKKSVVVTVGGREVGIIGYLTQETTLISNPGRVRILDEVIGVQEEAKKLKAQGVKILIAVGHAGYEKDKEIAEKVAEIDVVVGGHTNTFLWNGKEGPSNEIPEGSYPTVVNQSSGRKVPVVQAYTFGKYLGNLMVSFNKEGEVVSWSGSPILMDKSVCQDPIVLKKLIPYKKTVDEEKEKKVGQTGIFLDGDRRCCRLSECNLGNIITNAYLEKFKGNDVDIALLNSGAIRSSIDATANKTITYGHILSVAPFPNTVDVVKITGQTLKDLLELSVKNYNISSTEPSPLFLQVSGIKVTYDLEKPLNERVVELWTRSKGCNNSFSEYNPKEIYSVAMTSYFADGKGGFNLLQGNIKGRDNYGYLEQDAITDYVKKISPVTNKLEWRIKFLGNRKGTDDCRIKP